jgi:hypothetical protein
MPEQSALIKNISQAHAWKTPLATRYQVASGEDKLALAYIMLCNDLLIQLEHLLKSDPTLESAFKSVPENYEAMIKMVELLNHNDQFKNLSEQCYASGLINQTSGYHSALWGGAVGAVLVTLSYFIGAYFWLIPIAAAVALIICAYGIKQCIEGYFTLAHSQQMRGVLDTASKLSSQYISVNSNTNQIELSPNKENTNYTMKPTIRLTSYFFYTKNKGQTLHDELSPSISKTW